MEHTLQALAAHLHGRLIGDGAMLIHGVNTLEEAQEGDLAFAEDARRLEQAIASHASALIVSEDINTLQGKSGISVTNPKLAFALALDLFHPNAFSEGGVHSSAVLGQHVQLGTRVSIRAHAVIGNDVSIGQGTMIESGVHVGDGVTIGEDCLLGPNVVLYRQTHIGHRVRIHAGTVVGGDGFGYVFYQGRHVKVPQVGNVIIEDDVELGCNVCVDRATMGSTIIKRGTKIDNLVQIAHNDRIGQHVIMTGQVGLSGSVTIGDYAMLGGQVGVVDHVTIGPRAQVGAASVVTKSIPADETVWGYPARPMKNTKHQMASLNHLPALLKRAAELMARMVTIERRVDRLEHPTAPSPDRR